VKSHKDKHVNIGGKNVEFNLVPTGNLWNNLHQVYTKSCP